MGGDVGRPGPGEELNTGGRTEPRVAASVIVVRGGADTLEVLLVRRTPEARFMGGVWVFPGGAVDPGEDEHDAALRELEEEAAIAGIGRDELVRFSRWITPAAVKIRYDTHFFLAPLPDGAQPRIDGREIVDSGWFTPRDAPDGPEVLLVQRNPDSRFMGGAWVFPGGAVHDDDAGHAGAALRELEEEAGMRLADVERLIPFSRWITPAEVKTRFDTLFFVAEAPPGAEPRVDGAECVDARWIRPADALAEFQRGELLLVFPTIKHLEQLEVFASAEDLLERNRGREVLPILPKVVVEGEVARVVLPGEPGYEA